jgi:hypothetical protein
MLQFSPPLQESLPCAKPKSGLRPRKSTERCDVQPCPRRATCAIMVEAVTVGTSQLVPTNCPLSSLTSRFCPQLIQPNRSVVILALIQ